MGLGLIVVPENKILVIRGGAIGDFILTLPVLAALRQQFPETRLELLGYPHIAQLALAGGLANAVRPIEARALAGFFAQGGRLDSELANYFSSFALTLSYLYDPDRIFQENVVRIARTQFIPGPHRPDDTGNLHATEIFLQPLERLAIFGADPVPRLTLNPQPGTPDLSGRTDDPEILPTEVGVPPQSLNQLALHPGSGSERKNLPEAKWAELLEQLVIRTDFNLLLVGGEAEGDRLQRLAAPLPPHRVVLAQNLPLAELAARLQHCTAFAGHDSGISHLAAALGIPTLVLWGETSEAVWRPRGPRVRLVHGGPGLRRLEPGGVLRELLQLASADVK
jgi:heptosyltransferase-2